MTGLRNKYPQARRMKPLLLSCMLVSAPLLAQPDAGTVDAVINEQAGLETEARQSQARIADLDVAADALLAEYRQVTAEAESLRGYIKQMDVQVGSQLKEMAAIEEQFGEIETTARGVLPLMERMIDTLDQFVALDMPFLPDERSNRIASLREMMTRADVSVSEKYRRILEAYGIEMDYGRTIEAYRDTLETASGTTTVDILRLGRVTLLYQSLDGESTGYWDAGNQRWVFDNSYQRSVRQGLRIARQQTAPGLMVLPVAAPRSN
jgi:hypothetical protein